jgi:hypothetical protein
VNVGLLRTTCNSRFGKAGRVIHESQKVHRRAALFDVCHDLSAGDLQSCQQGLGAVTNVLVGPTPGLLALNGNNGWVPSSAWMPVFSSTQSTSARSGGFK